MLGIKEKEKIGEVEIIIKTLNPVWNEEYKIFKNRCTSHVPERL